MNPRLALAVDAGKAAGFATRLLGRGGGTAVPGLVSERIEPRIARLLASQIGQGRVAVTGTNGKTTTTRILARIFEEAGLPFIHNREGSNLMRGITSRLIASSNALGHVREGAKSIGLFETDEATLPAACRAVRPTVLAFTNLFRDQLDRYGEVDTVASLWRDGLAASPKTSTLVLNADDPSVAELAIDWPGPIHWFGLDDPSFATTAKGAVDARWCRVCGGNFRYERRYFAHVGFWSCTGCTRVRPDPDSLAGGVRLGLDSASFSVDGLGEVTMPLTGLYNVYNAMAAIGVARVLGMSTAAIRSGLSTVQPAFGRQEVIEIAGRRLRLLLCKNPAGANQVLQLLAALAADGQELRVAVLLNDRFADGQDVSWTWDVDYEALAGKVATCWVAGDRAEDMALRLKYAHWPAPGLTTHDPAALIDAIVAAAPEGSDIFVIPTYTALLDFRAAASKRAVVSRF
ncbi:hypothetical protein AYO38_09965 [bacterium SCGC AG-212-C10]|nr:hypothetical protein AYO38_09965 [bacterium SCGC AG-212-C10]